MEHLRHKLSAGFMVTVHRCQIHLHGVITGGKLLKPGLGPGDLHSESACLTGGAGFGLRLRSEMTGLTAFRGSVGALRGMAGWCRLRGGSSSLLRGRAGEAGR